MVESPQEAPISDFPNDPPPVYTEAPKLPAHSHETIIDIDIPIDVNIPRDTTNIFYDYSPEVDPNNIIYNQTRLSSSSSDQVTNASVTPGNTIDASSVIVIGSEPTTPTTHS